MQPADMTVFRFKYRNESGPESYPFPSLTTVSAHLCMYMCGAFFFRCLSYFLPVQRITKILSGTIFLSNHIPTTVCENCECENWMWLFVLGVFFFHSFLVVIYSQKQIALNQWLSILSAVRNTGREMCHYQPNMAWSSMLTRQNREKKMSPTSTGLPLYL